MQCLQLFYWILVPSKTSLWKDRSLWGTIVWAEFFSLWGILYGTTRSTHSVSKGLVLACLGGSLPYSWLVVLALCYVGHFLHKLWTVVRRPFHSKCIWIVFYVRVYPGWQIILWYQYTVFFCSTLGKHIFLFQNIKWWFWSPPQKVSRL